jgi:hypothetical protein
MDTSAKPVAHLSPICDQTHPTRLHYQYRCWMPAGHDGAHTWIPELLART